MDKIRQSETTATKEKCAFLDEFPKKIPPFHSSISVGRLFRAQENIFVSATDAIILMVC